MTELLKEVKVTDPEIGEEIGIQIHRDTETGQIFGVPSIYVMYISDSIQSPFNPEKTLKFGDSTRSREPVEMIIDNIQWKKPTKRHSEDCLSPNVVVGDCIVDHEDNALIVQAIWSMGRIDCKHKVTGQAFFIEPDKDSDLGYKKTVFGGN